MPVSANTRRLAAWIFSTSSDEMMEYAKVHSPMLVELSWRDSMVYLQLSIAMWTGLWFGGLLVDAWPARDSTQ